MNIYPQIYYVYFYLRSKDSKTAKAGTPYYVGKGVNSRAWEKHHGNIKLPKDKFKIILVEQNLTELQAFILERYYIRWFGRKDLGTGILINRTEGGEGVSSEDSKREQRKRVENGTHPWLTRKDGTNINIDRVNNGTHHLLKRFDGTSVMSDLTMKGKNPTRNKEGITIASLRVKQGTHNLLKREDGTSVASDQVKKGINPLQRRPDGSSLTSDRSKNGTHNFFEYKDTVPCINKKGEYVRIPREMFWNQVGKKDSWEFVHNLSKEGKKRKI